MRYAHFVPPALPYGGLKGFPHSKDNQIALVRILFYVIQNLKWGNVEA